MHYSAQRRAIVPTPIARLLVLASYIGGAAACGERVTPLEPESAVVDRAWVAAEAAAALDASGRFRMADAPQAPGELTAAQAAALGEAYARTFGPPNAFSPGLLPGWEADRGAAIDLDRLALCPRPAYTTTPYELPPATASMQVREVLGAHWLVSLCDAGGRSVVSIAVSAQTTGLRVEAGRLVGQSLHGFFTVGVSTRLRDVPFPPETAVGLAARATGRRVVRVPELVQAPTPYAPQVAKWRVVLDGPVWVRGARSGERRQTAELYVGFGDSWHEVGLQTPNPAAAAWDRFADVPTTPGDVSRPVLTLVPRAGHSLRPYELVSVERP